MGAIMVECRATCFNRSAVVVKVGGADDCDRSARFLFDCLIAQFSMDGKADNTDELRRRLRDAGLRATSARVAVMELLAKIGTPETHQEISDQLQSLKFDKSTIFRALNDLAAGGLARRMELGDHVWRYELARSPEDGDQSDQSHPHLLCVVCGSITCLTENDIEIKVSKAIGPIEDVLLKGHCVSCVEDQ